MAAADRTASVRSNSSSGRNRSRSLDLYLNPHHANPSAAAPAVLFEWNSYQNQHRHGRGHGHGHRQGQGRKRRELPSARSIREVLLRSQEEAIPTTTTTNTTGDSYSHSYPHSQSRQHQQQQQQQQHYTNKLIIVRSCDDQIRAALEGATGPGLPGVEQRFLDAHRKREPYRGRITGVGGGAGAGRRDRGRGLWWEIPEEKKGSTRTRTRDEKSARGRDGRGSGGGHTTFSRVSLWIARPGLSIAVLGDAAEQKPLRRSNLERHRRQEERQHRQQHQRRHSFSGPNPVGADSSAAGGTSSLEDEVWECLGAAGGHHDDGAPPPVEEIFAEAAWRRWLALARRLDASPPATLSRALGSLEAQLLSCPPPPRGSACRHHNDYYGYDHHYDDGHGSVSFSREDMQALVAAIHRRLLLPPSSPPPQQSRSPCPAEKPPKDENDRGLDRIAYLGGVVLPITVVSGVLAIEGPYGPRGGAFWVFWVASGVCCVAAVLVIYVDQVRRVQVWMQVAVDDALEAGVGGIAGGGDMAVGQGDEYDDNEEGGSESGHGGMRRVWRRRELGWGGAVKKVSGWYWVKGAGLRYEDPER